MVYKRGKKWAYKFDAPGSSREARKTVTKSGYPTRKAAQDGESERRIEEREKYERSLKAGPLVRTLGELVAEFIADCERRKLAPMTVARYKSYVRYYSKELMSADLADITPLALHHEWRRLAESGGLGRREGRGMAVKTVRNMAGMIATAFSRAMFWGLTDHNPTTNSEPPRGKGKRVLSLTEQQVNLLLDASTHPVIPILLTICFATGVRRGEAMALRWSDIEGDQMAVARSLSQVNSDIEVKTTKTENIRIVALPDWAMVALKEHRAIQVEAKKQLGPAYRADLDLIVCGPTGEYLKPNSISATVSALCRRLGMPQGVSLHTLRHAHASLLLSKGLEVTAVAERLGHSSVSTTTSTYAHAIPGRSREAARLVEGMRAKQEIEGQTQ